MSDLDPKSEIALRADEIRIAAQGCVTVLDLARKLSWPIPVYRPGRP